MNTDQPGRIGILVDSAEVMPGSATPKQLVRITFDVAAEASGDSPIMLTNSAAAKGSSDAAGNDVSMRWLDGYVKILADSLAR